MDLINTRLKVNFSLDLKLKFIYNKSIVFFKKNQYIIGLLDLEVGTKQTQTKLLL